MDYTFHDPKVIQFLQNNPDLHLDHLLLALLPLIELINPQNNTVNLSQINQVFNNFSKINDNIAILQNNYTSQVDLLKSFILNNNQTLVHSLQSSDSSNFSQIIHNHTQSINNIINDKLNVIQSNVESFNNILNNPSKKGNFSELKVESMLSTALPNIQIIPTHNLTASGDFLIEHHICGNIIVENKEYNQNVPKSEIDKFIRDMENQNSHGILISQSSGIANKFHLQFDLVNNKIAVYLLHTHYNHSHINDAVNVIQSLLSLPIFHNNSNDHNISTESLNELHKDYIKFKKNNDEIINNLQSNIKALKSNSLISFESFLASKFYDISPSNLHICPKCKKSCKSKAGLTSHIAKCS
jgi:hypothetical protein